ncbi:MAG: thiamine pyrophosphate-binding protein [Cyanobacteriota/Melainabacteria group bacterium]
MGLRDTFDQGAYFREFTKWDYQLKGPHHMETVVDRALAIAESDPAGPVYLTLPKEALCMKLAEEDRVSATTPCQRSTYMGMPAPDTVAQAARMIAESKNPLIITAEAGRYPGGGRGSFAILVYPCCTGNRSTVREIFSTSPPSRLIISVSTLRPM